MFRAETFVLAARLMAGFYVEDQKLGADETREKCRSHARFSLDNPWRGILPVPFDQRQQEVIYTLMMRAVEDVLKTGTVVPPDAAHHTQLASFIATFMIDHDPLTPDA